MSILDDIRASLERTPYAADDGCRVTLCKGCIVRHFRHAGPDDRTEFYGPTECAACRRVFDGSDCRSFSARRIRIT